MLKILGVPFNGDGTNISIENPSEVIRNQLLNLSIFNKINFKDYGDLEIPAYTNKKDINTGILNFETWKKLSNRISEKMKEIFFQEDFLFILAGDCSVLNGIFDHFKNIKKNVGLIFFDGHADFKSVKTSESGEPADMELAVLTGYSSEEAVKMTGQGPLLNEEEVIVFGITDYDLIEKSSILVYDYIKMFELGIENAVEIGVDHFITANTPVWIHFDVDVLDTAIMPAVMFPVSNGFTQEETKIFFKTIFSKLEVIGMSVSCYHPNLDYKKKGLANLTTILEFVLTLFN